MVVSFKKVYNWIMVFALALVLLTFNVMKVIEIGDGIPFNIGLSDILVPFIGLLIFVGLILDRSFKTIAHVGWFALLMGWLLLTSWLAIGNDQIVTNSTMAVVGEWGKTALCIAYFYMGYQVLKYMSFKWFMRLYSFGYGVFVGYGLLVVVAVNRGLKLPIIDEAAKRYFIGTYHDPNQAALYITVSFFLLLYAIREEHWLWQLVYGSLAMASFGALFLTDSRGGLLGFGAALLVYVLLTYYDRISGIVTLMFTMMMVLFGSMIFDARINGGQFFNSLAKSFMNFDSGLDVREGLMKMAWFMGKEYPLTGVGRGNYIMNAGRYAEQAGFEIEYNIPHNTYVGLFAEVGIIGLLLYGIAIGLIVYKITKGQYLKRWSVNRYWLATLLAIATGVGIEAFVLNVENRRTLWLLAGVLVYALDTYRVKRRMEVRDKSPLEGGGINPPHKWYHIPRHSILNIVLGLLTLCTFWYAVGEVHVPTTWHWQMGRYEQVLPVPATYIDQPLEVEFYLYAHQRNFPAQSTVAVTIEEIFNDGDSKVHEYFVYPRTSGTAKLAFEKTEEDSVLSFKIDKISTELGAYRFQLKRIIADKDVLYMNRDYYLISSEKETNHLYGRWEENNQALYAFKSFMPQLKEFEGMTFGGMFALQTVKTYSATNKTFIEITYKVLKDVDDDYTLWLYGNPDNVHYLPESRFVSNNEHYTYSEEILTSDWQVGESHTVTYEVPRDYGWYRLVTGVYHKVDEEVVRLLDDETDLNYVVLGWFEAGNEQDEVD